jgi:1,4-alpha-glucan branching enzyme
MRPKRGARQDNGGCRPTEFRFEAPPGLQVGIAGTFNNWDPCCDQMREDADGSYRLALHLPPGKHEYRFVIGDEWRTDPQNPDTVVNSYGSLNSVVTVQ